MEGKKITDFMRNIGDFEKKPIISEGDSDKFINFLKSLKVDPEAESEAVSVDLVVDDSHEDIVSSFVDLGSRREENEKLRIQKLNDEMSGSLDIGSPKTSPKIIPKQIEKKDFNPAEMFKGFSYEFFIDWCSSPIFYVKIYDGFGGPISWQSYRLNVEGQLDVDRVSRDCQFVDKDYFLSTYNSYYDVSPEDLMAKIEGIRLELKRKAIERKK